MASEPENEAKKVKQTLIVPLMENQWTKQAEVIWTLDIFYQNILFDPVIIKPSYSALFLDSQISQKFACGQTKCKCFVCHALAPYLKELLGKTLSEVEHFVGFFDEYRNHVITKGQMDLHVWFWDSTTNSVKRRYFNSQFLGKAATTDILSFKSCMNGLDKEKLLQVSIPFLAETLEQLLHYCCSKFVKKNVILKSSTASKLIKIDFNDENNLVSVTNLDLGFGRSLN